MSGGQSGEIDQQRNVGERPLCHGRGSTDETYICCDDHGRRRRGCDACAGTGWLNGTPPTKETTHA